MDTVTAAPDLEWQPYQVGAQQLPHALSTKTRPRLCALRACRLSGAVGWWPPLACQGHGMDRLAAAVLAFITKRLGFVGVARNPNRS